MANQTWPYNTPGNYTFDSADIEVTGGLAKLIFSSVPWAENYDSPAASIRCLVEYNGKLYAGSDNSGIIYVYDGVTWSVSYDSPAGTVYSLAVYNGKLYAGTGGAGIIYEFDDVSWSQSYDAAQANIWAIAVYNGKLYAGTSHGGYIYEFDGVSWSLSYNSPQNDVYSLAVYNGDLYAGTSTAGIIYKYNGISWVQNYDAASGYIRSLAVYKGKLYAGATNGSNIYVYDGVTWSVSYAGIPVGGWSLLAYAGKLYAGGGGTAIYEFDDVSWSTSFTYSWSAVYGFAVYDDKLFAGSSNSGRIYVLEDSYPTNKPTIEPTALFNPVSVVSWDNFVETLGGGNAGSIGYNLYKVDKVNKYYWNGSAWVTGGSSINYNSAAVIDANIGTFDATPDEIGFVAYLISDGEQAVELDDNQIVYTDNQLPVVNAGTNKACKDNQTISPFSDCSFSDLDGTIDFVRYKIDGEVDVWTDIPIGGYGSLLLAVQAFQYQFNTVQVYNVQLQVEDNVGATAEDTLSVTVTQYTKTVNIQDSVTSAHLLSVSFDPGDGSGPAPQNSPFSYSWDYGSIVMALVKTGYVSGNPGTLIDDETNLNLVLNEIPIVDAGTNKACKDNQTISPFSDCSFSDSGTIDFVRYKVDGEVDVWTDIPIGGYGSLLLAVQAFQYQFNTVQIYNLQLQVEDNETAIAEDMMTVTVTQYTKTVNIQDSVTSAHLSDVSFDPGDGSGPASKNSPFVYSWDYGNMSMALIKVGYVTINPSILIDNEADLNLTLNGTPLVDAGTNKACKDNQTISPFSDCSFSDSGSIDFVRYKVDGEVDVWTDIPIGGYGSLLLASQNFQYQFSTVQVYNVQLQVEDNDGATVEDTLSVTVTQYTKTVNIQDSVTSAHLSNVLFDPGDGTDPTYKNSPFVYSWDYGNTNFLLAKADYKIKNTSSLISDETDLNLTMVSDFVPLRHGLTVEISRIVRSIEIKKV